LQAPALELVPTPNVAEVRSRQQAPKLQPIRSKNLDLKKLCGR
jgi:hypothetical protein